MKKFSGFTSDQQFKLLSDMGYKGPKDEESMAQYVSATPSAAAKLGQYANRAMQILNPVRAAEGTLTTTKKDSPLEYRDPITGDIINNSNIGKPPTEPTPDKPKEDTITSDRKDLEGLTFDSEKGRKQSEKWARMINQAGGEAPEGAKATLDSAQAQMAEATRLLAKFPDNPSIKQLYDNTKKELEAAKAGFNLTEVPSAAEATSGALTTPEDLITKAEAEKVQVGKRQFVGKDTGQVTDETFAEAAKVRRVKQASTPEEFEAATIRARRTGQDIEEALADVRAAQAKPSKEATVQGQLEGLMAQFEGGATPPWASGAMRQAMAVMQQRGLGASSMAGQAVVQAAMESAIAIASQDASTVAQFEMKNLDNRQQTTIYKSQQRIASIMSDAAAQNAAKQFNAANKTQVDQFFASMQESVSRFNADQVNGIRQFNVGQKNSIEQFNTALEAERQKFNAANSLVIAQANAKWRQDIATLNTSAQNAVNMENAKAATGLTESALDNLWQRERDLMSYAFTASESALDRLVTLWNADKQVDIAKMEIDAEEDAAKGALLGSFAKSIFSGLF